MLTMKSVFAADKRTIGVASVNTNLSNVPGWIEGTSLALSEWNIRLDTPTGSVDLTNLSYPIQVHHDFGSLNRVTKIYMYRSVGAHELYIDITPITSDCIIFDLRIEFIETEVSS